MSSREETLMACRRLRGAVVVGALLFATAPGTLPGERSADNTEHFRGSGHRHHHHADPVPFYDVRTGSRRAPELWSAPN